MKTVLATMLLLNLAPPDHPGTTDGARALLQEMLKPGADQAALTARLRPSKADYAAVYMPEAASRLQAGYDPAWDSGSLIIRGAPEQTHLLIWSARSEEIKAWTAGVKEHFPGGYQRVGRHLRPGVSIYVFKFVKPGETLGMAFDGLVYVGGHWRIIPKPWRFLE